MKYYVLKHKYLNNSCLIGWICENDMNEWNN